MSFLDRFKPQPKWRHADPVIRAAAIAEMPDDAEHRTILLELASEDADLRVRRAAAARLKFAEDLVRIARTERDEDFKRVVAERLVSIASAPSDDDGEAALALEGLDDQRHLSAVAKTSPHDTVRTAALGRVHDVRSLGSVARHAADAQTALDAVTRIADRAELVNVALKTNHKDAGLTALERASASEEAPDTLRETLDAIASRARNKAVAKRARGMLQSLDEAEAARRAALETWQQRVAVVMARLEALVAAPVSTNTAEQLADTEAAWRETSGDGAFQLDQDTVARYSALIEAARYGVANHEREQAERRAAEERRLSILAAATSLCNRVDAIRWNDTPSEAGGLDEIDQARAEWEGLRANEADVEMAALRARFDAACERAGERFRNRQELQRIHVRLDEISLEAERLSVHADMADAGWDAAVRHWEELRPRAELLHPGTSERYQAAVDRVRQRHEDLRAAAERAVRQHVQRVEQLLERAAKRSPAEDLTLREADRLARELRSAIDGLPPVDERERHALVERLRAALATLSARLHDLREMDEWKRFANAAVQEELIAKTEALRIKYGFDEGSTLRPVDPSTLQAQARPEPSRGTPSSGSSGPESAADPLAVVSSPVDGSEPQGRPEPSRGATSSGPDLKREDLETLARQLHEIQERWKTAAEAPRAQAQALWHRYRLAADPMQARVREFFTQRNEERRGNLERKIALVARAETLADSTDWIKTADELKKLQIEWQQIGPVPRQETRATWKRFREACDRFFTRRNADLAQRKEAWAANLGRKEAICARAEELASSSTDWEKAAAELRRLQAEWRNIGPVRRNKSDAIWQRFRAGSDLFFERYKRRDEIDLQSKQADREALVVELESLAPPDDEQRSVPGGAEGLLERVRSLRSRWNLTTPVVRHGADPLSGRFMAALERVMAAYPSAFAGTELDADANRQKMERLCVRVEGFLAEGAAAAQPAGSSQALADMLREALAANTIGGRAGEESKWRTMAEDVRQAQAAWNRFGPVPGEVGRALTERFHRACNRFHELYRRKVPPQPTRGKPVGTR